MVNIEKQEGSEIVYKLGQNNNFDELEVGGHYHAAVDRLAKYGVFVRLSRRISGLVHESAFDREYKENEEVVVQLREIKENGDLSFIPAELDAYRTQILGEKEIIDIDKLEMHIGKTVEIEGIISQRKETTGPLTYSISDGTGIVRCVEQKQTSKHILNQRGVEEGVRIIGTVRDGKYGMQLEIEHIEKLEGENLMRISEKFESNIAEKIGNGGEEFLVDWPALLKLRESIEGSAEILIRAVFSGRPIIVRHHADVDGICAGLPIEKSLKGLVTKVHMDERSQYNLIRRVASRAPYYDMEDAVHDLNYALTSQVRHGQMLPLLVLIDNGSTEEDTPAYEYLQSYEIPIVVIDHHYPNEEEVEPYLAGHVNPYIVGEDYRITTGMICAEIAGIIDRESMTNLKQLPAISGVADRSSSSIMEEYLSIARMHGFEMEDIQRICDSLDYMTYVLRHNKGEGLVEEIIGMGDKNRFKQVTELLSKMARENMKIQTEMALKYTQSNQLETGVVFNRVEIEVGAYKNTYPAPGKTTSSVHDHLIGERGGPMITIGYGSDFAIIRSDGIDLDIPQMVERIKSEIPSAGVSGGGHLVVGSMKFVPGESKKVREVLEKEIEKTSIKIE